MILDELKSKTADVHASLERRLRIAQPAPTLHDYRAYLTALYGFTVPLEQQWLRHESAFPEALELSKRCKAHLLERDLRVLDAKIGVEHALPTCSGLPDVARAARALGSLYVLEGSTLGARWLLRHLQPLGIDDCSSYLQSYGEELGPMWQKMRGVLLDHESQHPADGEAMVEAARETFERLESWLVACQAAEASRAA